MAAFLGKELSEAQIDLLKEHLQFENIQKNDKVNMEVFRTLCFREEGQFVRKGIDRFFVLQSPSIKFLNMIHNY